MTLPINILLLTILYSFNMMITEKVNRQSTVDRYFIFHLYSMSSHACLDIRESDAIEADSIGYSSGDYSPLYHVTMAQD